MTARSAGSLARSAPVQDGGGSTDSGYGALAEYDNMVSAIAEVVRSLDKAEIPADLAVTENTRLADDLNLDSLAVMDFVMALENRFDLVIPMDELSEVETVGDLARLVMSHAKKTSDA